MTDILTKHDRLLTDDSDAAAIVARQALQPALCDDAVIFPSTFAMEDNGGYNIDRFDDGRNVCLIDSVGSQANRIEPLFKNGDMAALVPKIEVNDKSGAVINLLDLGHRAADAIARFTPELNDRLYDAFQSCDKGDYEPMARIAPTTVVFGAWDSRATQVKLPRLISSVIRAENVDRLTRSAQYETTAGELLEGVDADKDAGANSEVGLTHVPSTKQHLSISYADDRDFTVGLTHVPSTKQHGGVIARGGIYRDIQLYLVPLRRLRSGDGSDDDSNLRLRRYIFGLCIAALTAWQDYYLREGCQLIPKEKINWTLRDFDGGIDNFAVTREEALEYARAAAAAFGVETLDSYGQLTFDGDLAMNMAKNGKRREEQRKRPSEWSVSGSRK